MCCRYSTYFLFFFLLAAAACDSTDNIEPRYDRSFIKLYGGVYQDEAADFIAFDSGGFAILGSTRPTIEINTKDIILFITDSRGDIFVQKTYGDTAVDEEAVKIIQIPGYLFLFGYRPSRNESCVYKINFNGDTIQTKAYPGYKLSDMVLSFDELIIGVTGRFGLPGNALMVKNYIDINSLEMSGIPIEPGEGYKIMRYNSDSAFYRILRSKPISLQKIEFDVISLTATDKSHYLTNPPFGITDSGIEPIDMWGEPNSFNWYYAGYSNPQDAGDTIPEGPILISLNDFYNEVKKIYEGRATKTVVLNDPDYSHIRPANLIKSPLGGLLLLGTEITEDGESDGIRLLKLTVDFTVEKSKSFGTGDVGDQAVKVEILPDGSVVFLATVNYQLEVEHTKIALFKLTPDLELDY
ncbi:MAG TPA: hypothetical protein VI583_01810 [Cyclobacteriaceae bacterium]|nr:hypothetical protein [Cyclobacteriaceae bacterium]